MLFNRHTAGGHSQMQQLLLSWNVCRLQLKWKWVYHKYFDKYVKLMLSDVCFISKWLSIFFIYYNSFYYLSQNDSKPTHLRRESVNLLNGEISSRCLLEGHLGPLFIRSMLVRTVIHNGLYSLNQCWVNSFITYGVKPIQLFELSR